MYCKESGKRFIGELDTEDFIAYRAEYAVPREHVEQLKGLLGFHEHKLVEEFCSSQDISNKLDLTLKNFFDVQKKEMTTKTQRLTHKKSNKFLQVESMFRNLPEDLRNKRARPFLLACGAEDASSVAIIPENLTLAELPKYLVANSITLDTVILRRCVRALHFDLRACTKKIITVLFKNKREFDIIRRRAEGIPLDEIEKIFGVTDDEIRQIELKLINRFMKHHIGAKKILCFLHALTDGKSVLTLDDMKTFLDVADAEGLWFLITAANLPSKLFHFDEELNALVFADKAVLDGNKLTKNLPDVMDDKVFKEAVTFLAREKNYSEEIIKAKLLNVYRLSGKVFHRSRLTFHFKCAYVFKERFPNGYKIGDELFYLRFVRYVQEIFDDLKVPAQCNVDAKIGTIGVLCDRGKYIHPDFVHVPSKVMEVVQNFIAASDRIAIFYKEIFETLKDIFVGTQITNHYFLQGAIKFYRLPYKLFKHYLTKSDGFDMTKEFNNFVVERGEVSVQDIKENFISFTDVNIDSLLPRCPAVIRTGHGTFMHVTHLNLREEDFEPIKKFLKRNCSKPVSSRILFDCFFERFADFMLRNDIQNHDKLFGVLQYMFRDGFSFSRPYISAMGFKGISNKKVLLELLENTKEISIEDLLGICEENGISYNARTCLIDGLRPEFVRVDEFILMRPEAIGVTSEVTSLVAKNIRAVVERNGGWQAAQTFEDYEWLPQLARPWNSFLLESVSSLSADTPYGLKIPSKSANWSSTIFLSEKFADDNFQSFLIKILSAEHKKEPFHSEREIFNWLKTHGLCNKNLPKFLTDGRAFELLGEEQIGDWNVCLRMGQRDGRL